MRERIERSGDSGETVREEVRAGEKEENIYNYALPILDVIFTK